MDTHDPTDPNRPPEGDQPREQPPADEGTTQQQPQSPAEGQVKREQPQSPADEQTTREQPQSPAAEQEPVRRLFRSRTDKVLGGVCGGIGRYFGVDPIIVRIVAVVGLLLGGATLVAYVAAMILVPAEPEGGAPVATRARGPLSAGAVALILIVLFFTWPILLGGGLLAAGIAIPVAILALMGMAAWWLVAGEGPGEGAGDVARRSVLGLVVLLVCALLFVGGAFAAGVGGGTVAAAIVIGMGVLLVAGAFAGGLRWLALPAVALGLGVGLVSAADLDLSDGVGERDYRPSSAAELRDRYELGMGELVVDLRQAGLPRGDTRLGVRVGMGEALLVVPRNVCVASAADVGAGEVSVFDRSNGGVDLDWEDNRVAGPGGRRLIVDADVGLGELQIRHDRPLDFDDEDSDRRGPFDGDRRNGDDGSPGNAACAGGSLAGDA